MAFDAFFMKAVLEEIQGKATAARVEKIHQPSRDTVILHLRCEHGREKLIFSPNPAAPRLHLTSALRTWKFRQLSVGRAVAVTV